MPGLSQLKQFNNDILALGNETSKRSSRGEKPVSVPIPEDIQDVNDSEDFVLGMPHVEAETPEEELDEDLSDLANIGQNTSNKAENKNEDSSTNFDAPDLSDLLSPGGNASADSEENMPDLSFFEESEPELEPEIEEEPEPEEVSIADMGLEALLAGTGFDEPEEENLDEEEEENLDEIEEDSESDEFGTLEDFGNEDFSVDNNSNDDFSELDSVEDTKPSVDISKTEDIPDDFFQTDDFFASSGSSKISDDDFYKTKEPDLNLNNSNSTGDLDSIENVEINLDADSLDLGDVLDENTENPEASEDLAEASEEAFDLPEDLGAGLDENIENPEAGEDLAEASEEAFDLPEDLGASLDENIETPEASEDLAGASEEAFDLPEDLGAGLDENIENPEASEDLAGASEEVFDLPEDLGASLDENIETPEASEDLAEASEEAFDLPEDLGAGLDENIENPEASEDLAEASEEAFDLPEDLGAGLDENIENPEASEDLAEASEEAFDLPEDLGAGLDENTETPEASEDLAEASEETQNENEEDFSVPDLGDLGSLSDNVADSENSGSDTVNAISPDNLDVDSLLGEISSEAKEDVGASFDPTAEDDEFGVGKLMSVDEALDEGLDENMAPPDFSETIEDEPEENFEDEEAPVEKFDISEMEGLEFPETDAQIDSDGGFNLGNADDFLGEGEFEIPGFSDVETIEDKKTEEPKVLKPSKTKAPKGKNLPEADFSDAIMADGRSPNTLTDEEYKQFLKNLSEYPLNVRLAFEDLIVQDEFTDDAEFEIIEKILHKAPARQVASTLEKMLDISLPVPRDFEHRTAEEYEAYKKSLSYQLRNKIIPIFLLSILALIVGWGLFKFTENMIYKPLRAISYYKQGYELIQRDEYPQSEISFNKATKYGLNKKWFYKYARSYRDHKQYIRAEKMYENILYCFNHDKDAGLEYSQMELYDLANYEKAEEIIKRQVLDYHINDKDGLLALGDIYLEWGTEKDSSRLDQAREQYASLIQLYKANDLYLSRMLRYFMRSDNLRQVLQLKQNFDGRDKSMVAEDWAELGGYLLDKAYGPLAPSDEYLRYQIEGVRGTLVTAVKANPQNPVALYNLARYFIQTSETNGIENALQNAISCFNKTEHLKKRDLYKYIDSYRLLGENYVSTKDYLRAQEQFAEGLSLYTTERDNAGFEGNEKIGKLYQDMGDIKYFISGEYDDALLNYTNSVDLGNDSSSIRYRIGYIQYKNDRLAEALGSFMKAGDGNIKERNLLLAMANTLSLRGDDYAAEGYYNQLISTLDDEIAEKEMVFPQTNISDNDLVSTYLMASNNYGVTLYRLAQRTGNSSLNAQAIVQMSQSVRAWDALTRNQETLVRLSGSNLAEQNIKYITHRMPEYEPAIYTDISKTLTDREKF